MKRLMSVLFIAAVFASCSSDDDNKQAEDSIVGAWTLVELNAANPIDFNNDGTADPNIMIEIPCFEGNVAFTADGNFLMTLSKVEGEEVNGQMVFSCNGSIVSAGSYVLQGDQLTTITSGPDPETSTTTIFLNGDNLKTTMSAGELGNVEFVLKRN